MRRSPIARSASRSGRIPNMRGWGRIAKRSIDILVSLPMILLLSPVLLAAALAIRFEDGGYVFFRQERIGHRGRPFRVWKFRTMTVEASNREGPSLLREGDRRITKVGRVLRHLGLDEIPQLINVLTGEMSLVGPRPTMGYQVAAYTERQRRRLEVKPGLTSLAVVSGRNAIPWTERIELDVEYIERWSLWLDLGILWRTLWCVLISRQGLYGADGVNDAFVDVGASKGNISRVTSAELHAVDSNANAAKQERRSGRTETGV